ncbi:MAG: GNAT family N-acetyltransferase [Ruminococcus sp.]
MCSITRYFSSSLCSETGFLSDIYIEPVFRKRGIAHMLCEAAMDFCKENNIINLSVFLQFPRRKFISTSQF